MIKTTNYITTTVIVLTLLFSFANGQDGKNYVTVYATVKDKDGSPIRGLKKENFQIFDEDRSKEILSFAAGPEPMTIGFLIDDSGSMEKRIPYARQGILEFLKASASQNEYLVVAFNEKINVLQDFTKEIDSVKKKILDEPKTEFRGQTKLNDAIYSALAKLSKGAHSKKVLIIASDSMDNQSGYRYKELRREAQDSGVLIYTVNMADVYAESISSMYRPLRGNMEDLGELSGGLVFYVGPYFKGNFVTRVPGSPQNTNEAFTRIASILENQYAIRFEADKGDRKNEWREIEIKLDIPGKNKKELEKMSIAAREGYFPISAAIASNKE